MARYIQLKDTNTGENVYPITADIPLTEAEIEAICDFEGDPEGDFLPVATKDVLGCVAIGSGIDVDENGKITTSGVQMELLWENASPTAAFAAQTIALDLSEYDMLFAKCSDGSDIVITRYHEGYYYRNAGLHGYARTMILSDTCITISDGRRITSGSTTWVDDNTGLVPYRIYGIRRGSGSAKNDIENLTADYVVEEGTSGTNWYYRKWNSGRLDLNYLSNEHVTLKTAIQTWYRNADVFTVTFPFEVTSINIMNAYVCGGGGMFVVLEASSQPTNGWSYWIGSITQFESTVKIRLSFTGKWK